MKEMVSAVNRFAIVSNFVLLFFVACWLHTQKQQQSSSKAASEQSAVQVCACFGKSKVKKKEKSEKKKFFEIFIRFRCATSSCFSDFFGILRLKKVVVFIIFIIFTFSFPEKPKQAALS